MKKYILHFIKLTLVVVSFLQVGEVSAQVLPYTNLEGFSSIVSTTCNAATVACLGTDNKLMTNIDGAVVHGRWSNFYTNGSGVDAYIKTYFHASPYEIELELNDGTFTPKVSKLVSNNISIAGTFSILHYPSCGTSSASYSTDCWYVPLDFAEFTIPAGKSVKGARITLGTVAGSADLSKVVLTTNVLTCAVTSAPTLSANTLVATCPSNTANLNSLVTSTTPSGATLKWYSDNTLTTEVTTPTAVAVSGTYYAFYVDTANNCFSPASAAVTVTANCPINVATVCPEVSIDLSTRVTSGTLPSGYTYTYHSGTPATTANKLSSPVVSTSGTYYLSAYFAAQDCYATTSRPMVITITNCCATLAPPTFN